MSFAISWMAFMRRACSSLFLLPLLFMSCFLSSTLSLKPPQQSDGLSRNWGHRGDQWVRRLSIQPLITLNRFIYLRHAIRSSCFYLACQLSVTSRIQWSSEAVWEGYIILSRDRVFDFFHLLDLHVYPLGVYHRLRTSSMLHTITQQYKKCYIKYINVLPLNRVAGAFAPFFHKRTLPNAEGKPQLYSSVHAHALLLIWNTFP